MIRANMVSGGGSLSLVDHVAVSAQSADAQIVLTAAAPASVIVATSARTGGTGDCFTTVSVNGTDLDNAMVSAGYVGSTYVFNADIKTGDVIRFYNKATPTAKALDASIATFA